MNTNYFWLNCGYNRFNHFEDLMGQVSVFDSTVHFNPSEGYTAFKRARVGDKVIFYQVQNKIGLLGAGTVIKYEEPKRGQIKIHFQYDQKLKNLSKDYLERSEQLKTMLFKMKEQLLNPIAKEDYELIMKVGRGEDKIKRFFLLKEDERFEKDKEYTIFVRTINGFERNGFKHYREMQSGDQAIIYRTAPERGIYGVAEIVEGMHRKPIMPGRTDTTAITIRYLRDIEPRSIYDLDREPMLRGQYFIGEEWNESVTELTKLQYEVMLEPNIDEATQEPVKTTTYLDELIRQASEPKHTKNIQPKNRTFITPSGRKFVDPPISYKNKTQIEPEEQVEEQIEEQQPDNEVILHASATELSDTPQLPIEEAAQEPIETTEALSSESIEHEQSETTDTETTPVINSAKSRILHLFIVSEQLDPFFMVKKILNVNDDAPYYVADKAWTNGTLYGQYVEDGATVTLHDGILTKHLSETLIIEDIDQIPAAALKPLFHAAQGRTVQLGFEKYDKPATLGTDGMYTLHDDFKLIGITTRTLEEMTQHYPEYMHGQIKVYQLK